MAHRALLSTLGDVDIRLLRVFVVVAECNGIAASELQLNIGKSTISKHISDLEHRIGLRLCNRGPSGFSLTREGVQVLKLTLGLLAQLDEFQAQVDGIQRALTGTIRVGLFDPSSTNPQSQVHKAIARFDEMAPGVSIILTQGTPSALEAGIADGSLDLAIGPLYRPSPASRYTKLYSESMYLYCGPGHPLYGVDTEAMIPKPDLSRYKYAGYGFGSPNMRAGNAMGLERLAQVDDSKALALMVKSGCYLGYLADYLAIGQNGQEELWPILPNETAYTASFAAILRERPEPDRKTLALLDCLVRAHDT